MHERTEFIWEFLDTYKPRLEVLRAEGASPGFVTGALIVFDWLAQYAKDTDDLLTAETQADAG